VIQLDGTSDQNMFVGTMLERSIISTTARKRATWRLVPFVEDYQNHRDIVSGISLSNCVVCQLLRIHQKQTTQIIHRYYLPSHSHARIFATTYLAATLSVTVLFHIGTYESDDLLGCEDIEKSITCQQQELVVVLN
jgi:hypothetical protein